MGPPFSDLFVKIPQFALAPSSKDVSLSSDGSESVATQHSLHEDGLHLLARLDSICRGEGIGVSLNNYLYVTLRMATESYPCMPVYPGLGQLPEFV